MLQYNQWFSIVLLKTMIQLLLISKPGFPGHLLSPMVEQELFGFWVKQFVYWICPESLKFSVVFHRQLNSSFSFSGLATENATTIFFIWNRNTVSEGCPGNFFFDKTDGTSIMEESEVIGQFLSMLWINEVFKKRWNCDNNVAEGIKWIKYFG